MKTSNLERMIQLAEDFFATKNDPTQISVTEEVMTRLRRMHPATMSERDEGDGPVAWILLIPTTQDLMEQFIAKQVNEQELLAKTPLQDQYSAVYLCSALVLPECRRSGLAKALTIHAIKSIKAYHPIKSLFYWAFSPEGERLASSVSRDCGLPLFQRPFLRLNVDTTNRTRIANTMIPVKITAHQFTC